MSKTRWERFKSHRRAKWSLYMLIFFTIISLTAELIANDRPLLVKKDDHYFFPVVFKYAESDFGGEFETPPNYRSNYFKTLILEHDGWMIWPPLKFSYDTHDFKLSQPAPSPPSWTHPLGTDDRARDILANLIYGYRISLGFGLGLTFVCAIVGLYVGALQGFYGGRVDLYGQRFIEIWTGLPSLYVLIILSSFFQPGFWMLFFVMFLFGWPSLVSIVRATFLKGRCLEYVVSAKMMGVSDHAIMFRHIFPNAMVVSLTLIPFMLTEYIAALTALDFLGFGLPAGSASLGALLAQSKSNIYAPWIGLSVFFTLSLLMSLLVFVGEGIRDAFDPRLHEPC